MLRAELTIIVELRSQHGLNILRVGGHNNAFVEDFHLHRMDSILFYPFIPKLAVPKSHKYVDLKR